MARQSSKLQDEVRFLGGVLYVLGVWRIAHDPAKVGDQVRLLTRILDAGARRPGNRLQPGRSGFVVRWIGTNPTRQSRAELVVRVRGRKPFYAKCLRVPADPDDTHVHARTGIFGRKCKRAMGLELFS